MNYEEALRILFAEYGRKETFVWMDINKPTREEIIKEALKVNG